MMDEGDKPSCRPEGGKKRNLVDVLHHAVVIRFAQVPRVVTPREERISVARPHPVNVDPVESYAPRSPRPAAAEQIDNVATIGKPGEYLA